MNMQETGQKVTRTMTIASIVQKYPGTVEVFAKYGVHCVGCNVSYTETVEQGIAGHAGKKDQIDAIITELNEAAERGEVVNEGPIGLTEKAVVKLKQFMQDNSMANRGLRIDVIPGGCSGYQYAFELEEESTETDEVIEVEGIKLFIDRDSMPMLSGSKIDYIDTFQGAGFKVVNPNAKSSCACGQSFH